MARKTRLPNQGKLRTREHVLADLSVNYVERRALLCNFSINRIEKDYGLDLLMSTYNQQGEMDNGHVYFQLKATDNLKLLENQQTISVRIELADVRWWGREAMPVILVVYDGKQDRAYWLYVQQYLQAKGIDLRTVPTRQHRLTLHVPTKNRLDKRAVVKFQRFRHLIVEQTHGVQHGQ